ncbi:divalent metal cation transporter, partial [Mesorhizobium sp. M8A.F.Ca.ET.182.01.1.1]
MICNCTKQISVQKAHSMEKPVFGWRRNGDDLSLSDVHSSIRIKPNAGT